MAAKGMWYAGLQRLADEEAAQPKASRPKRTKYDASGPGIASSSQGGASSSWEHSQSDTSWEASGPGTAARGWEHWPAAAERDVTSPDAWDAWRESPWQAQPSQTQMAQPPGSSLHVAEAAQPAVETVAMTPAMIQSIMHMSEVRRQLRRAPTGSHGAEG